MICLVYWFVVGVAGLRGGFACGAVGFWLLLSRLRFCVWFVLLVVPDFWWGVLECVGVMAGRLLGGWW